MAGRVSDVYSYQGALGSLDNYTYTKTVQLDADGNVIDYYKELEEAGKVIQLGDGWDADAPYEWLIRDGIYSENRTGNNTQGITDVLYGNCDITITPISSSTAELRITGKGITFDDSTKDTAACIAKFPLVQLLTAYGRAFGYDMTYSDADNIINNWPKDDEWEEGILPFLGYCFGSVKDNIDYFWVSNKFANKLKNWLISKGANSDMVGHEGTWSAPTTVQYSSMQMTALLAYELLFKACQDAGMDLTSASGRRIYDLYQYVRSDFQYWENYEGVKIGSVTLDFGKGGDWSWSTFAHYSYYGYTVDEVVDGDLVYPPEVGTSHVVTVATAGTTYRHDYISYSGLNAHDWYNASNNRTIVESITLNLTEGEEGGSITLSTIGNVSDRKLPVQLGATLPNANDNLTTTFPNWSQGGRISTPTGTLPSGINTKDTVLPIVIPPEDPAVDDDPVTQDDSQEGDNTEHITKLLPFLIPLPSIDPDFTFDPDVDLDPDADIPDIDIPDPSIPIIPFIPMFSGSGNGMVNIYNPTFNQVALLTQFLWSDNFFTNIKKIFQDPMQAIISLSIMYATPSIADNPEEIIIGTVATGVDNVNVIDNQYIDIDCGTIKINRYYGNVLDYINTTIEIFLPFIGFVNIDTASAMDKEVNIRYRVDVLTGTCVAFIYVGGILLYNFNGNCAVQLPISAQNYSNFIASSASLVGSVVTAAVTKNPAALIGAAASVPGMVNRPVEHGGNLTSNAGAMGVRKPYILITRNTPYNPSNYNKYYGFPSNTTVKLGNCGGYTRIKDIRLSISKATQQEKNELETLLKGGVIL